MRKLAYAAVVLANFCSGASASSDPLPNAAEPAGAAGTVVAAVTEPTAVTTDVAPTPVGLATAAVDVRQSSEATVEPPAPRPAVRPPPPSLVASIDLSTQRMTVSENGRVIHRWPISSGRAGYRTPTGTYRPQWLSRMHYSRKYDNAPMPYSVFFHHGYAIHGTDAVGALGRPASHGCIRLAPAHAKTFYKLVEKHGKMRTRIALHGDASVAVAKARARNTRVATAEPRKQHSQAPRQGIRAQQRRYVWPGEPSYYRPQRRGPTYGYFSY